MIRPALAGAAIALALGGLAGASCAGGAPLEALSPTLAEHPYRLEAGVRPYLHRLAVTPSIGQLGNERLFAMRVEYSPSEWLAWQGSIAHDPGQPHALLHTLSAIVRRPLAGRFQPYLAGGYGMIVVFPGLSTHAIPVTKNAFVYGGGLEVFIRSDLALRADLENATVFGRQGNQDGIVAYQYLQETIGVSFCRTIKP